MGHGPGPTPWTPRLVSLNVSYHKEQEYILVRGGDLNGFSDLWPFMKWRDGAWPRRNPGDPQVDVTECV